MNKTWHEKKKVTGPPKLLERTMTNLAITPRVFPLFSTSPRQSAEIIYSLAQSGASVDPCGPIG